MSASGSKAERLIASTCCPLFPPTTDIDLSRCPAFIGLIASARTTSSDTFRSDFMTHTPAAAVRLAESDFRVGHVLRRAVSMLLRRFLTFFIVPVVTFWPLVLLGALTTTITESDSAQTVIMLGLGLVCLMVLSAVILHAAFQDMRNRPVNLVGSLKVGLRRFLPLILLGYVAAFLIMFGFVLLIVPGLILYTMWFVAVGACVVERLGPWKSLRRSEELTRGHRWKIFGLQVFVFVPLNLVNKLVELALSAAGGETLVLVGTLIWTAIEAAFYSVVIAVTYHDLRVAKEGIDNDQIAAVFD
jgi:hypothetical protein